MCNEKKNELLKEKDDAEEKGEPFDVERELEKFISMLKYNYMRAISDYVDADDIWQFLSLSNVTIPTKCILPKILVGLLSYIQYLIMSNLR